MIRKHPVTLRHALRTATGLYQKYADTLDEYGTELSVRAHANLIMEMWHIDWSEDIYDSVTEVIKGKLALDTGMAMFNAYARRQAELEKNNDTT